MEHIRLIRHKNNTERNSLTRMSIGEAIIQLINKKEINELKVSEICKRAGVSRMTFYHYYESKEEALQDYLMEIIGLYLEDERAENDFGSVEHIIFTFRFFEKYRDYILGLKNVGCSDILINGVNSFLEEHFMDQFETSIYELYFYAGALLNTFIKWLEGGEKEPVEELAAIIAKYRRV